MGKDRRHRTRGEVDGGAGLRASLYDEVTARVVAERQARQLQNRPVAIEILSAEPIAHLPATEAAT